MESITRGERQRFTTLARGEQQSFTPFFIDNILNDCTRFRQVVHYSDNNISDDEKSLCDDKLELKFNERLEPLKFSERLEPLKFSERLEPLNLCKNPDRRNILDDKVIRKKKLRTTFTGRQIYELEKMFENKKYLNSKERTELSRLLNVTEQQVKIWFQNRRTKWKKQEPEDRKFPANLNCTPPSLLPCTTPPHSTPSPVSCTVPPTETVNCIAANVAPQLFQNGRRISANNNMDAKHLTLDTFIHSNGIVKSPITFYKQEQET